VRHGADGDIGPFGNLPHCHWHAHIRSLQIRVAGFL
jgi:hypothetical protein